jgi:hypothetical protein
MTRQRLRTLALLPACLLLLAVAVVCAGCGGNDAADYEGHWYSTELAGEWWGTIERDGGDFRLTWERLPADRYVERAILQDDGSLLVEGSALGVSAKELDDNPERFYRLVLNDDGRLEIGGRATEDQAGSEPTKPILTRGDDAAYAEFKAKLDPAVEKRAIDDEYIAGVETIRDAIRAWAEKHEGQSPPVDEVRPGGAIDDQLQTAGKSWPVLMSGEQLSPGDGLGEFVYRPGPTSFKITGLAPTGQEMSWTSSL